MKILIDPGHGARDPGAQGNGLVEKDLTIVLALRVEERLDNYDCHAEVYQHPAVDGMGDLETVVRYANDNSFDFFLSLHINSVDDPKISGFESYRYLGSKADYQLIVHNAVVEYMALHGIRDRGPKEADFYVLRETDMPLVLLECGFLSNPHDAGKLQDYRFVDKLANAIAWGIVQAFGLKPRIEASKLQDLLARRETELAAARDRYMAAEAENRRLHQVIDRAGGILAPEMHK